MSGLRVEMHTEDLLVDSLTVRRRAISHWWWAVRSATIAGFRPYERLDHGALSLRAAGAPSGPSSRRHKHDRTFRSLDEDSPRLPREWLGYRARTRRARL